MKDGEEQDNPRLFEQEDRGELDLTLQIETWKNKYEKEHKLRQEAETETILVKGIGMNSPEMKDLKKKVEELKAELARAKEDHQYDNLVHQKELKSLRKNEKQQ